MCEATMICSQCSSCPDCSRALTDSTRTIWPAPDTATADALAAALRREGDARIYAQLTERPAIAEAYGLFAADLVNQRRFSEAKHLLDRALTQCPDDFLLCLRRAECHIYLDRPDLALIDLERASSLVAPGLQSIAYHQELLRWVRGQAVRSRTPSRPTPAGLLTRIASRFRR